MRPLQNLAPACLLATAIAVAVVPGKSSAGYMSTFATCTGVQQITLAWDWWEDLSNPVARPDWVGYDVVRRPSLSCGPWIRLNASIFPRTAGASHSRTYADNSPAAFQTYEYKAIPVDANRDPVIMLYPECEPPCSPPAWASCPSASAPLTVGRLDDFGWAIFVMPCANTCYWTFFFSGPVVDQMRSQGLIGTTQELYGTGVCCGVEGAFMQVDHWAPTTCGETPAKRTSWGRVKTIYR